MSIHTPVGKEKTITTVGELRRFIENLPEDMRLNIGFGDPIEIRVMENLDTGERYLELDEQ